LGAADSGVVVSAGAGAGGIPSEGTGGLGAAVVASLVGAGPVVVSFSTGNLSLGRKGKECQGLKVRP
jgi:hypothetical protein